MFPLGVCQQCLQLTERNIIWGTGCNFVLEADEDDCCFLGITPQIAVITNTDWEHADMFQDESGCMFFGQQNGLKLCSLSSLQGCIPDFNLWNF
ncbi:hypothetical protein HAX54_025264 [Datura stramonium]|nr:hypothetical protein [Datura stramonium]